MTKSGGNGHQKDVQPENLEVFEPAFAVGDESAENIGYFKADIKGEEGQFIRKLPQELSTESSTPNDESETESDEES